MFQKRVDFNVISRIPLHIRAHLSKNPTLYSNPYKKPYIFSGNFIKKHVSAPENHSTYQIYTLAIKLKKKYSILPLEGHKGVANSALL